MTTNSVYDIVLVYPKTGIDLGATISTPHSVLAIAAPLLKKGYRVQLIDQRIDPDWRASLQAAVTTLPICVGISCMTGTQIHFAMEAAAVVRATTSSVPIIWGGPHPSLLPEQTLESEFVDAICIGEGEETFLEMVEAFQNHRSLSSVRGVAYMDGGKAVVTPPRPLMEMEDLLPVPWELIEVEKYIHPDFWMKGASRSLDIGQTSRGCPFLCGFCASATLRQRKWRPMSVEKSLETILEPVRRFGLNGIWIRDDEFYINPDRVAAISEGILSSGHKFRWYTSGSRADIFNRSSDDQIRLLKRSGADSLKFGAESGSDRILELMNKGIKCEDTLKANEKAKRCGIIPVYALMAGFPTETFAEIDMTIDLFVRLKKENPAAQFEAISPYTAFPGTPLYSLAIEHGLTPPTDLEGWIDWVYDEYDFQGRKLPWFNAAERKMIGNIAYMSILSNSIGNAVGGIGNKKLRSLLKMAITPVSMFERFKLKRKWYGFAPELDFARFAREKIFYRGDKSIG